MIRYTLEVPSLVDLAVARLPAPAFRAVTRARWATRDSMRRARNSLAEWLGTPLDEQPKTSKQRTDRDLAHADAEITFQRLFAAYTQANHGRTRSQIEAWRLILERDGHLRGMVENRVAAVAGKEWSIVPGGAGAEDEAAREIVEAALGQLKGVRNALFHLLACNYFGHSCAEIDWEYRDGVWMWTRLVPVHAEAFCIATEYARPEGATVGEVLLDTLSGGERLVPGKWAVAIPWGFMPTARAGLLRPAAYYSLFKLSGIKDWGIWSHRHGIPFVVATATDSMPPEPVKQLLFDIVENFGQDGGAAAWGGIEVKAVTDTSRNAHDGHASLIRMCNAETAKLINGGTLSNDNQAAGAASYALGEVHQNVRLELLVADALLVQSILEEQLFAPFMHFNRIGGIVPGLRLRVLPALDPETLVRLAENLAALGVSCSVEQLRQMTTLRPPKDDDDATRVATENDAGTAAAAA